MAISHEPDPARTERSWNVRLWIAAGVVTLAIVVGYCIARYSLPFG